MKKNKDKPPENVKTKVSLSKENIISELKKLVDRMETTSSMTVDDCLASLEDALDKWENVNGSKHLELTNIPIPSYTTFERALDEIETDMKDRNKNNSIISNANMTTITEEDFDSDTETDLKIASVDKEDGRKMEYIEQTMIKMEKNFSGV